MERDFFAHADRLLAAHLLVIDRPRGTAHPRYPDFVYTLDYGYLDGTKALDGGGVDVFVGSLVGPQRVTAVVGTIDLAKGDTELKLAVNATPADLDEIQRLLNAHTMRCIVWRRPEERSGQ
jgi:inorganic pyrophosphatase